MEYYVMDLKNCFLHHTGKSAFITKWTHYERVWHEAILYIVIDGTLYLEVNNEKLELKSGDAVFMKPNTHHIGYDSSEVSFFWLHCVCDNIDIIDETEATQFSKTNTDPDKILIPCHFHLQDIGKFLILMNQLVHYTLEDPKNPIIPHLFYASLVELTNQNKNAIHIAKFKNRRFQEIVAYIHANFKDDLKIHELAERFEYNEKYLGRLFKKYFGITAIEYINHVRLDYCALQLLETTDTITAIAHDSGFKNEFYFMRCFKKRYNISASQYRNTYHLQMLTKF